MTNVIKFSLFRICKNEGAIWANPRVKNAPENDLLTLKTNKQGLYQLTAPVQAWIRETGVDRGPLKVRPG
jgi:hypothetical protein